MAGWVWNEGVELCQSNQHLCCLPKEMRLFETACWFGMLPGGHNPEFKASVDFLGAEFFLWLSTGRMSWRNTRRQHLGRLAMQLRLRWHNISCQRRSSRSASWQSVCAISQQAFARLSTAGKQWMDEGGVPSSGRISMCSVPFLMLFSWKEFWKAKAQQGWGRNYFWSCGVCKQPTISDIIGFRSSRITRVVSQVWQQKGMLWVQQRMEARLKKSWSGGDCRDSERYGIPPLLADQGRWLMTCWSGSNSAASWDPCEEGLTPAPFFPDVKMSWISCWISLVSIGSLMWCIYIGSTNSPLTYPQTRPY